MPNDIIPYEPYHPHLGYTLIITLLASFMMLVYSKSKLRTAPRHRVAIFAACLALPVVAEGGAFLIYLFRPGPQTPIGYVLTHIHASVINRYPIDTFFSRDTILTALVVLSGLLLISLVRFVHGTALLRNVLRHAQPISAAQHVLLLKRVTEIATQSQRAIPRIEILETAAPLAFAAGILHPYICLSSGLLNMLTLNETVAVICHEWAHVIRRDTLWNWATRLLRDMLFFVPGQHLIWRSMIASEEEDCDRFAITLSRDPIALARALVKVAASKNQVEMRVPIVAAAPFALADHSPETRVQQILAFDRPQQRTTRSVIVAYLLLLLFFVLALLPPLLGS